MANGVSSGNKPTGVVDLCSAQTLTCKTLTDPKICASIELNGLVCTPAGNPPCGDLKFYAKTDGTLYTPTLNQASFINSNAQFSAMITARAGGKSAAGSQKAMKGFQKQLKAIVEDCKNRGFNVKIGGKLFFRADDIEKIIYRGMEK